jgi:uncharacterized membrane protein
MTINKIILAMKIVTLIILITLVSCNFKNPSESSTNNSNNNIQLKESEALNKTNNDLGELISTIQIDVKANQEELKNLKRGLFLG